MKYLMAIDAGTGSIRAIIFNTLGVQIGVSQKEWIHLEEKNIPNSMSFDFKKNWKLTVKCIKEVIKKTKINPDDILSISATSMREGIVLYDKNGDELWAVANVDARASLEVKYLKENLKGIEKKFYNTSGQTFALGALPRLLWLKNNKKEIYEKVSTISMIGDWILAKLSNIIATDPSNAGTTGVFSLKKRAWDASMAKKIGLKSNIFCPCYETGTIIGNVTKEVSNKIGLSTKTKIVTGGGDVQLGSAGLGLVNLGQAAILGGSFWQQIVNISNLTKPPKDMSIRVNPHVIENQSQAEGITFFSGLVMRWFRDVFCQQEISKAKKLGIDVYNLLEQKAKKVPVGSNGVIPIFSDSMNYGKWYHASPSFLNLNINPEICNIATMFRSLQENACIVSNINLKKIEKFTNIKTKEIVFASGASNGELWCQILADVTNCKVKVPVVKEATALGAAMSAAVGVGLFDNLVDASNSFVKWEKEYIPNKKNHKKYKKIENNWAKAYKVQLKLVDENITTSMWKAPGL
ncbi:MAG: autoinducer-2 kinase [Campylobacterota bacterium]|nr:autoinducer-2 kinase [Campylobacterota bacterium]